MTRIVTLTLIVGSASLLALIPIKTEAGGCGVRSYTPVYKQEVVREIIVPVAVPVLIPATVFQFTPAFAPIQSFPVTGGPVSTIGAPCPTVNAPCNNVNVPMNNQPNTMQNINQPPQVNTADIDRLVRERLEAILKEKMEAGDSGPPMLVMSDLPTQQQDSPQELQQKALSIMSTNCYSCHTKGVKTAGSVTLFTRNGQQLEYRPSVPYQTIMDAITSGRMPKGKAPISSNDLAILQAGLPKS